MARERHDAAFILGALLGGIAGGVVGLVWAPQAGARTRADLASGWTEATERAGQAVAGAEEQARALLHRDSDAAPATPRRPLATAVVGPSGPFIEPDGDPVMLLPDPLEPDPVAVVETEIAGLRIEADTLRDPETPTEPFVPTLEPPGVAATGAERAPDEARSDDEPEMEKERQ